MFDIELAALMTQLMAFIGEFDVFILAGLILAISVYGVRRLLPTGR